MSPHGGFFFRIEATDRKLVNNKITPQLTGQVNVR